MLESGPVGPPSADLSINSIEGYWAHPQRNAVLLSGSCPPKKTLVGGFTALVLGSGTNVYADVPLVLASMGGDHGTVVESGDLDAVLSPNAFDHWNRPHVSYMIVAVDRRTNQIARIAGSSLSLLTTRVLSQGFVILAGRIYRGSCSDRNEMCAVTSETLADVWGSSRTTQIAYSAMGAFAGLSLG